MFYDLLAHYIGRRIEDGAFRPVDPRLAARAFFGIIVHHRLLHDIFGLPMHRTQAELSRRGFSKAASGEPDFYMTYYVLVTAGTSDQYMGQFLPGTVWGIPYVPPATSSLSVFPHGALILDVTSRAEKEVVWRGVAQAEIKWDESQTKRDQRIRDAVQELLKQLPPKPKKK